MYVCTCMHTAHPRGPQLLEEIRISLNKLSHIGA